MSALVKLSREGLLALIPSRERVGLPVPNKLTAYFGSAGNFTFVLIETAGEKFIGVTKRNPVDKLAGPTGLEIAAVRAYRTMIGLSDEEAGYCRQRPVTKKEAKRAAARALIANSFNRDGDI
jgi:hypothetical protein